MFRIKPVNIICDVGVSQNQFNAVTSGINELLRTAKVQDLIQVRNFGAWRSSGWKRGNELVPYNSVDWYMQEALTGKRNEAEEYQLHGEIILGDFCDEPWQTYQPHYDVMITSMDLYAEGCNWVLGVALPELGTVISTWRWQRFSDADQFELIKTETEHELGHVFGLPNENRGNLEHSLDGHCRNKCVMRQGLWLDQWKAYTQDRISHGALCPECKSDLYEFFRRRD